MMTGLDEAGLMRQAWITADEYLGKAITCIDERFGKGYARDNPALVGAFIQAASHDFAAGLLDNGIDRLVSAINDIGSELDSVGVELFKARTVDQSTNVDWKYGGNPTYTLRRLARDRPDLFERVMSGELSINKAAIEAGWRKPPDP